jgi:hypothetical protein
MIIQYCPNFIYKPSKEQIDAAFLSQHPQLEEAELNTLMSYYELLLLNNWNNQVNEDSFDWYLSYPIDAGAFSPNLPDTTTA